MREIKFRAWLVPIHDESAGYMVEVNSIMGGLTKPERIFSDKGEKFKEDWGSITLLQYTGYQDAKRKDIYEGDILCVIEDVVAETIDSYNRYEQEGTFMEVVFDKYGKWSIKGNSMVDGELLHDMLGDAVIIGNIYSTPELLTP